MSILITGSGGFLGRNLTEYFQSKYDDVYCPRSTELNLADDQAVHDYLKKYGFDAVIHCAVTHASVEQNIRMYFNIERCSGSFGKMLCIGSGAEFDKKNYVPKMKEEYFGKHVPSDIYGFSKYVIAKDIEARHRNIFNLRLFGVYGKYEDYKRRFISNNICRALSNLNISINRNMLFDYLYVDDFSRIADMFIKKSPKQRSYNICSGKSIDLMTFAGIIKEIDGKGLPITVKQDGLDTEYTADNTRFLKEFGDFDFTEPRKAIGELYMWYKDPKNITFDEKDLI